MQAYEINTDLKFKTRFDQSYHYSEPKSWIKIFVIHCQLFLHLCFFQLKIVLNLV